MDGWTDRLMDRPMDTEILPYYRSILTDRLDYLSRAIQHHAVNQNRITNL